MKGTFLCLHCSYTKDQILSGLGYLNASSVRQGVFYVSERKIDAFFVTIDKAEEDFSPSTRYDDYAIDSSTFHWQSQNATSSSSPTGQRYINHRSLGSDVFLFVRKEKEKPGFIANPYVLLGSAEYVSHTGSKPMSIIWKLEKRIPARYITAMTKGNAI